MELKDNKEVSAEEKIVRTICASHCGGTCPLKVHVKNGIIRRIESDDGEEPQFRACLKGRAYRQRVYAPDRLKYPMRRVGERGEGKFERISWDEALDAIAQQIKRVRDTYGPASLLALSSPGDTHWLHSRDIMFNLLGRTGGFTATWGWHSSGAALVATFVTYGTTHASNSPYDVLNSRLIIMWGWNPAESVFDSPAAYLIAQAKEKGTKIISVDPKYSVSTATFAQQWIPIRPGTDAAMLIAMAYVMIKENLYDRDFLDTYTLGFDKFKEYVLGKEDGIPKTPEWAAKITGVPAETILNLAREYATTKPAALLVGIAPGRTAYGEQYHRAAITLVAMTGNIGIHGGSSGHLARLAPGARRYTFPGPHVGPRMKGGLNNPVDIVAPKRRYSLPYEKMYFGMKYWDSNARIHISNVADAILKGKSGGYPADYHMLYVMSSNFVNQDSNSNKIARAFKSNNIEFIVVHEQFMTATARYADILLPINTFMERNDMTIGGATPFYGYAAKVIDPLYESKSIFEIASELAPKLGIFDFNDKTKEEWIKEIVKGCKDIPDYETFKKEGTHKLKVTPWIGFEEQIKDPINHPFPTPSGKIEIYSNMLADMGHPKLPAVPRYIETWESINDPLAQKYPLQLITNRSRIRAHSQFDNIPWVKETEMHAVLINSKDAEARGIRNGDTVKVFNGRGVVAIPAKVTETIMPGVVEIHQGSWYKPDKEGVDRGACANTLTRDEPIPGGGYVTNTCLVQIEKESA